MCFGKRHKSTKKRLEGLQKIKNGKEKMKRQVRCVFSQSQTVLHNSEVTLHCPTCVSTWTPHAMLLCLGLLSSSHWYFFLPEITCRPCPRSEKYLQCSIHSFSTHCTKLTKATRGARGLFKTPNWYQLSYENIKPWVH